MITAKLTAMITAMKKIGIIIKMQIGDKNEKNNRGSLLGKEDTSLLG